MARRQPEPAPAQLIRRVHTVRNYVHIQKDIHERIHRLIDMTPTELDEMDRMIWFAIQRPTTQIQTDILTLQHDFQELFEDWLRYLDDARPGTGGGGMLPARAGADIPRPAEDDSDRLLEEVHADMQVYRTTTAFAGLAGKKAPTLEQTRTRILDLQHTYELRLRRWLDDLVLFDSIPWRMSLMYATKVITQFLDHLKNVRSLEGIGQHMWMHTMLAMTDWSSRASVDWSARTMRGLPPFAKTRRDIVELRQSCLDHFDEWLSELDVHEEQWPTLQQYITPRLARSPQKTRPVRRKSAVAAARLTRARARGLARPRPHQYAEEPG